MFIRFTKQGLQSRSVTASDEGGKYYYLLFIIHKLMCEERRLLFSEPALRQYYQAYQLFSVKKAPQV